MWWVEENEMLVKRGRTIGAWRLEKAATLAAVRRGKEIPYNLYWIESRELARLGELCHACASARICPLQPIITRKGEMSQPLLRGYRVFGGMQKFSCPLL